MLVKDCMIKTGAVTKGMLVREVFAECGRLHIHALPFMDERGKVAGAVTLRNIMKFSCLPEHMVELAPLLGSFLSCVDHAEEKVHEVLCSPVDVFVRKAGLFIKPEAPAIKALGLMEKHNSSYLFVMDSDDYLGIITIQGIAAKMSEMESCVTTTIKV